MVNPTVHAQSQNAPVPRTRAEQLADVVEARIRESNLHSGASVGTIASLRRDTKYSYATVSEAVRLLRDRGVIEVRPGRHGGLFVADRSPAVRLRQTLLHVHADSAQVADAIELREHLELLIALGAARHRDDRDLADFADLLEQMRDAPTWDAFVHANWALHARIAQACPNILARAVYLGTLEYLDEASATYAGDSLVDYRVDRYEVHATLVRAIASGDAAEVRAAVQDHGGQPTPTRKP